MPFNFTVNPNVFIKIVYKIGGHSTLLAGSSHVYCRLRTSPIPLQALLHSSQYEGLNSLCKLLWSTALLPTSLDQTGISYYITSG